MQKRAYGRWPKQTEVQYLSDFHSFSLRIVAGKLRVGGCKAKPH